eukprot:CAMPEP_0171476768 /NCGR_PEP_ID=MMETSP0946-20130122/3786_1 /TAXON_ID=109269 /ORGANISM="Vaucheria litorea, Strain CCMP2940" /LENGTH=85 /DNA_ID=CAMNT_0012007091 /DNA_START=105 /DNA_END=359 /DNA_ORIENTATION=-
MKCGLLLNVVVTQSPAILQLLPGKNQTLLIRRNPFLILDLLLDIVDSVGGFDIESDGLSGQCFDEDLHASSQTKNKMKCGLLLNV